MADSWLDNSPEAIKRREDERDAWEKEHPDLAFGGNFKPAEKEKPVGPDTGPLGRMVEAAKSNFKANSEVPDKRPFAPLLGEDAPQETPVPGPQVSQGPVPQPPAPPPMAPAAPIGPPGGRGGPRVQPSPQLSSVTPAEPLSGAPQTAPPEAPKRGPSALEQLLAERESNRQELRAAQAESENRRNSALGLNAVRAGLAQMTGQAPDTEAERLQLEHADAPVRNVLARQKSDQEFQQQALQALEMDQKRDALDPTSPVSLRATMLAKASKLIPASHPGITAAEWQMAQQGGNFQEQVKQRQTQEAQEKSRAERERAQTAEEKRWHDMQYRMHMEAKKAASKTSPKELEDFEAMNRGLVATEKIKEAAKTNNPVLYSNVADNNIEDYAAGLNPGARQNPAIQKAEKDRMPGLGSKILGEGTDKSFNERHDAIRRNVRAALAAREDTPEYPGMLRIYAASEANVAAQHGRPVKMLLPGGKVPVAVPPANVEKEILAGGQVLR